MARNAEILDPYTFTRENEPSLSAVQTAANLAASMLGGAAQERKLTQRDYGAGVAGVRGYSFRHPDGRIVWAIWCQYGVARRLTFPAMPSASFNQLSESLLVTPERQVQLSPPTAFAHIVWNPS